MKLQYQGKTKDVFQLDNGNILLKFKDDVTGEDGVFDPGANTVGLTIEGAGKSGLKMTTFFFKLLKDKGIPTHFISSNIEDASLIVKKAKMFGEGLEVICRYRAVGSFYKRYGKLCEKGQKLDAFVEVTLKDDERGDPPISKAALVDLKVLTHEEYDRIETLTKNISNIVKTILAEKQLELYDIKLEFGWDENTGEIILIDEISGGNMRVYDVHNKYVEPLELAKLVLS